MNNISRLLNSGAAVGRASNKLLALNVLRDAGVSVPEFWTDPETVQRGKDIILARTMLRASEGRGITVVRPGTDMPRAPLYVRYVRKSAEYRVHVLGGQVAAIQQKRRRSGVEQDKDQQLIRNYDNGWVFAIENVEFSSPEIEQQVRTQAVSAVTALGLDFGAVDIVVNRKGTVAYVLEVNTAPGIESPQILATYVDYFRGEDRRG